MSSRLDTPEDKTSSGKYLLWVDSRYMQLLDATVRSCLQSCCSPDPFRDDATNSSRPITELQDQINVSVPRWPITRQINKVTQKKCNRGMRCRQSSLFTGVSLLFMKLL